MKETTIKAILAAALAGAAAYLHILLIPLIVLVLVMTGDYVTGMVDAWMGRTVSSRIGIIGIVKKVGYLMTVACGVAVDWILQAALTQTGVSAGSHIYLFGLLVTVWLIINELISILENLSSIGVPIPKFLASMIKGLQKTVEETAKKNTEEDKRNG